MNLSVKLSSLVVVSIVVVLLLCPMSIGSVETNLKYVKYNYTWQSAVNLHVIVNTQTTLKDIECSNYCTIRDSDFRKVFFNLI
jgi:hypothetical protein